MSEGSILLSALIRALGAAWRALRLYPAASPFTYDSAVRACKALEDYLQAEPSLRLDVVRGGFIQLGVDGVLSAPGVDDLTDALGMHGVGELHFLAPPTAEDLLAFLSALQESPHELHAKGGVKASLAAADVRTIKVVPVQLSKVEAPMEIPEEDAEAFFAQLAGDPARLGVWLQSLLAADDDSIIEGLQVLASAAKDLRVFGVTLALAFRELDSDDRDRMLETGMKLVEVRDIISEMLWNVPAVELVASIRGGMYGGNALSLSYALSKLPLRERLEEIVNEVEMAMISSDASVETVGFLKRMMARRNQEEIEPALADAQPYYRSAAHAIALTGEQLHASTAEVTSATRLSYPGALAIIGLLDSAADFQRYSSVLEGVSRAIPRLFEAGDPALALFLLDALSQRSALADRSWPGLSERFAEVLEAAAGPRTMNALVAAAESDPAAPTQLKQIVTVVGEPAARHLAAVSIESEADHAMDLAESVLGRRLGELLATQSGTIDEKKAARLAELLGRDGGPTCMQALGRMIARPEDRVRAETARGIANAGGPGVAAYMPRLLRDSSATVAALAARMLGHMDDPAVTQMLVTRLEELEGDKDITLAREIIGILSKRPSPAIMEAVRRTAEKGGLLGKAKHAGTRKIALEALERMKQVS